MKLVLENYSFAIILYFPCSCVNPDCYLVVTVVNISRRPMEHSHRFTLNITDLKTAHKRKDRSKHYNIVENNFPSTVETEIERA